jgi:naringenin degradation protein FdeE
MTGQRTAVQKVLVVGGGLAGLATAIGLGRRGVSVEVVDVTDHVEKVGLGLIGRSIYALEDLGVIDDCVAVGSVRPGADSIFSYIYDAAGRPLAIPRPNSGQRDPRLPVSIGMYRPELTQILREHAAAHGANLRYGLTVQTLEQTPAGVDVTFTDGGEASYDLVVGADGVRSHVRAMVYGDHVRPAYAGRVSLRWVLDNAPSGQGGFYNAKGTIVAVSRLRHRRTYVATGYGMPYAQVNPAEAVRLLREVLDRFTAPYLVVLRERLTADQEVNVKPLEYLLVDAPWYRGRVVIIGDAAHATTAHLTSMGGMAIEDGAALAEELARVSTVEEALNAFQQRRMERTRIVVETAKELLQMQLENADVESTAKVRNRALAVLSTPY